MLILVDTRRAFGQAHLWYALLASFLFGDGPTILKGIAYRSNIFIFQLVKSYFSSW